MHLLPDVPILMVGAAAAFAARRLLCSRFAARARHEFLEYLEASTRG